MREIVIISGKGGTGKTSLTGAFAHLAPTRSSAIWMWTPPIFTCSCSPHGSGRRSSIRAMRP